MDIVSDETVDEDEELKRALALSRQEMDVEDEEADLRRAIQLSMQGDSFRSFELILIFFFIAISTKVFPLSRIRHE